MWKSILVYFFSDVFSFPVCAQDKYTDPGETWYPPSLWQFEEAKDPLSGELAMRLDGSGICFLSSRGGGSYSSNGLLY